MPHPIPATEWLDRAYGIRPCAEPERIGGSLASVFHMTDDVTCREVVVRVSDGSHIPPARLEQVHAFLTHVDSHGVRVPLPLRARDGRSYAVHGDSARVVEVYPYIRGRHPARGSAEDATRVGRALAQFHNAGIDYADLPGEEACDQNHVALGRLEVDLRRAEQAVAGRPYEGIYQRVRRQRGEADHRHPQSPASADRDGSTSRREPRKQHLRRRRPRPFH